MLTTDRKLDRLIGLGSVKEQVKKLSNLVRIQQERMRLDMPVPDMSYHCVFTGNPGTGKTTVARIVAEIYKELGILKKGHLVETDRSGLVAEYVGQTAAKTNTLIDMAIDGVLFIDEAYALVTGGSKDYGMEAIATLLKRMEDDRDRLVVILAGYSDEMKTFIDANPGLKSRFSRYIHFDDYSVDEMLEIYQLLVKDYDYLMDQTAMGKLRQLFAKAYKERSRNFGNGRFVRNTFEKTIENQSMRLANVSTLTKEALELIKREDIPNVI